MSKQIDPQKKEIRGHRPRFFVVLTIATLWALLIAEHGASSATPRPKTPASQSMEMVHDGFRVVMDTHANGASEITPGSLVDIRFTISEAWDGDKKLAGLFPMAWLVRREEGEEAPDRDACKRLLRNLLAGRLARPAEVDLNKYYLLTLDDNNSVTLIDPQIESSKTKTIGMITLSGKGEDFVLSADRETVFVSIPHGGRVAAAKLGTLRARYLEVGGQPRRLALQPDGQVLWVGDAARTSVVAIDARDPKILSEINVGAGPHEFAFVPDKNKIFVGGPGASEVHVIDGKNLAQFARFSLPSPIAALAASAHGHQVYAALSQGDVAVFGDNGTKGRIIRISALLSHLAISPNGRFIFVASRDEGRLFIIDTAVDQVVYDIATGPNPDRIDFTEAFAYVRHANSERMMLIDLNALERQMQVSDISMGQWPLVAANGARIAPSIVPVPEGGGALILNEGDRAIYHFMEGMSAPMGSYPLYPWPAKGILLWDRSLHEGDKGVYESQFRAPQPGTYTVAFLLPGSPRIFGCDHQIEVKSKPDPVRPGSLRIEALFAEQSYSPGVSAPLVVRLLDAEKGTPVEALDDVNVLVFRGAKWQWRGRAQALADGRYGVEVRFPATGAYTVMVEARSRGVQFGNLPWNQIIVGADERQKQD